MKAEEMELARAYFRLQPYTKPLSPAEGLEKGTIWLDLYRPYRPRRTQAEVTRTFKGGVSRD